MPAFTFEKISSPIRRIATASPEKKPQRGVFVKLLNRLGGKRNSRNEARATASQAPKKTG